MATTPNGYGRFIGRVGGLAVALGIGVAIANGAAIASADDGQSGSSKSSSADSKSPDSKSSGSGFVVDVVRCVTIVRCDTRRLER